MLKELSNAFQLNGFSSAAIWGGAKLADVLELIGIPKFSRVSPLGGKHVEFVSIDRCKVNYLCLSHLTVPFFHSLLEEM